MPATISDRNRFWSEIVAGIPGRGAAVSGELRPGWRDAPAPSRLAPDHPLRDRILAAHASALAAGEPLYRDPVSGLLAMTADALAARPCCGNLCRHCPYVEG